MSRPLARTTRLVLLAVGLAGCGGPGRTPHPPEPPPPSPEPRAPDPGALAALELADARRALERRPEIEAACALELGARPQDAHRIWMAAREAFRQTAAATGLRELAAKVASLPPDREAVSAASRILLLERLLSRSMQAAEGPLFDRSQDPRLDRILGQGMALAWEPAYDSRRPRPAGTAEAGYAELVGGGRTFKILRSIESLVIKEGPAKGQNSRFLVKNPAGRYFDDPAGQLPGFVIDGIYTEQHRERLRLASRELEVELVDTNGDLDLVLVAYDLAGTVHPMLEILGADGGLDLILARPPGDGPPDHAAGGIAVRVRRELLPAPPRKLRVSFVGLQPVGNAAPTANLREVLQQLTGPPLAGLAGHAWGVPAAPPAPAAVRAELAAKLRPLYAAARKDPSDPDPHLAAGLLLLDAGESPDALSALRRADKLRPGHAPILNALGRALLAEGDRPAAIEAWWSSFRADPRGHGKALLEQHAPREAAALHPVASGAEFQELAAYLQDFRRQREVQAALDAWNVQKARDVRLGPANSAAIVADLAAQGFLARPGGPPSGRGEYLTDPRARVFSTVFGSREAPKDPPAALRSARGYDVPAAVAREALGSGRPEAFEFGLAYLPVDAFEADAAALAKAAAKLEDLPATRVLMGALARSVAAGGAARLGPFIPWLRRFAARPDREGWAARSLLAELGVRDLPPPRKGEVEAALPEVFYGRVPRGAVQAALDGMGAEARRILLAALAGPDPAALGTAAGLLPRYGKKADAPALAAAAARPEGVEHQGAIAAALEALVGAPPPLATKDWKSWAEAGSR